jgi:endogenous inhibitor of DNA gyrase (YacG/DUF329 family)
MAAVVTCPVCGKPVPWIEASAWRPFCSERCKMIDLGDWASERHVIPGSAAESAEGAPPGEDTNFDPSA